MGFSDRAAHKMAVLAMEQYGLALVDKFAGLESAATPEEAGAVHASGSIAVWRPSAMASDLRVAASWDVTSDSLSAIYAHESGAARLLLIKSVDVDTALDSRAPRRSLLRLSRRRARCLHRRPRRAGRGA